MCLQRSDELTIGEGCSMTITQRGSRQIPPGQRSYTLRAYASAEKLRKRIGLDIKSMAAYLGIDEKTYSRRGQSGELKGGESLKIEMLSGILDEATRVLGNQEPMSAL